MFTLPCRRDNPADGRQLVILHVGDEVPSVNDLAPVGAVANIADSVEGRPDITGVGARRSVVLPTDTGVIKRLGHGIDTGEAGELLGDDSVRLEHADKFLVLFSIRGIASPAVGGQRMEGVINDSERIRRNGIEMVRETRSMKRGEHLRSESKVPRVRKVI